MSEPTIYPYHVFVSYCEADQAWVQNELLPQLRAASLAVIEQSDFELGAPKLSNIEQAINNSHHTLIVITPAWLDSKWAQYDWFLVRSKDPDASERRLIPLRLLPCQLPESIAMLTYADFTNPATKEAEMKRLLLDLGATPESSDDHNRSAPIHPFVQPRATPSAMSSYQLLLTMLGMSVITTTASLLSNVVAGYLTPTFEGKRWLAVGLFALLSLLSFWISLAQLESTFWFKPLKILDRFTPRQLSTILLISVFLALIVWFFSPVVDKLWAQNAPRCPLDRVCVLAADFLPADSAIAHTVAKDIAQEIDAVLDKTVSAQYILRTGPAITDAKAARERAKSENDSLVVWGDVQENIHKLRIHFELVNLLNLGEARNGRAYRAEPLLYNPINQMVECFDCLYIDISAEVAQRARIVAYTTAGLVDYTQGQPDQARFALMAALACAGEPVDETVLAALQPDCPQKSNLANWNAGLLYYYLGKALILQGDYKGGIAHLERATTLNPRDPAAWIGIGSAYQSWLMQQKAPVAMKALDKAEALSQNLIDTLRPNEPAAVYHDLGLIYELRGDMAGAQKYYAKAVERFGIGDLAAYISLVSLGRVQRAAQPEAAQETLEHARALDPNAPGAYLELALLHQKERDVAEKWLQTAAKQASNGVYVYMTRADLCQTNWQDRACAREAYRQAVELRPDDGWLHGRVGDFYRLNNPMLSEDWEQAKIHYQKAVELRAQDPWAHERLAYVFFNQQAYAESIQEYQNTLRLAHAESENAELYCSLGRAQQRAQQASEAQRSFERCAALKTTK